jgi:hypothetical protein
MTPEILEMIDTYVALVEQRKELEVAIKALQPAILQAFEDGEIASVNCGDVHLLKASRKNWQYPEAIQEMEAELKSAKREAERKGMATYGTTDYLTVRAVKA